MAVIRRRSNQRSKGSGPSLTFMIGCGLLALMVLYIGIILTVTVVHWPTIQSNAKKTSVAERLEAIKDQRALNKLQTGTDRGGGVATSNGNVRSPSKDILADDQNKSKPNPVRVHHLENPLNHGVQPDLLLPVKGKDDVPIAIKKDIPIEEHPTPEHILTAYQEPLNFDDWKIQPLPLRTTAKASKLTKIPYPRLNSCTQLPQQWPVDDSPVDQDSFLPWIHDVFPSADGRYIQFVAQNKRRCKNGSKEKDILAEQQPQASLFQHVSLKREIVDDGSDQNEPRFRLVPHEDADPDALSTRFICRFKPSGTITLSDFNFDYDWTGYRKKYKYSFIEDDAGIKAIHSTQLIFRCPVPENLQDTIRQGRHVLNDWTNLFVDLIPVRTPPRFLPPNAYLQPHYKEDQLAGPETFDPVAAWGDRHILPKLNDSGRWENIPICLPSQMQYEDDPKPVPAAPDRIEPKHRLVSCIWASAGYTTRGNRFAINDGQRRLLEWLEYNLMIGFDHFYLYDNSGAFGDELSLKPIADLFPDKVTWISWPSTICNNNPNNVDSVGERSSQYAAESSCRLRFGPFVDWIGQFDIDEYLVPMGQHKTILPLLEKLDQENTKIIAFASWRAWPRWAFIEEPIKIENPDICWSKEPCFDLRVPYQHTMLQTYNCDRQKPGQKTSAMPAEKQLYRPDYVLGHFVHYSVATVLSEKNRTEYAKDGFKWNSRGFPDPRQRFGDELAEALMVHTKAVARQDTNGWERVCHIDNFKQPKRNQGLCRLGVPFPDDWTPAVNATKEGWAYNCYVNPQVENTLIPRLNERMAKHANFFAAAQSVQQQQQRR